jgi:hypothetical protein
VGTDPRGVRWHELVDLIVGWLTIPGDVPMGLSPMMMNSIYIYGSFVYHLGDDHPFKNN